MNTLTSVKVSSVETWSVAENTIARLRNAGLHPLDLSLSTPLAPPDRKTRFLIEVPAEEADVARELVAAGGGP